MLFFDIGMTFDLANPMPKLFFIFLLAGYWRGGSLVLGRLSDPNGDSQGQAHLHVAYKRNTEEYIRASNMRATPAWVYSLQGINEKVHKSKQHAGVARMGIIKHYMPHH